MTGNQKSEIRNQKSEIRNQKSEIRNQCILVFNTACFGDVLLCDSLCQNIKKEFPNSKIVFVADKNLKDAAQYQKGVDEVIIYDKKGVHKGFFGMLKFIRDFPYKKPECSFITYKNERNYIISKLIGSKKIIMETSKNINININIQTAHKNLLEKFVNHSCEDLPIKFEIDDDFAYSLKGSNVKKGGYIVLCTLSKALSKDMPLDTAVNLVKELNRTKNKVVYTGIGNHACEYAENIKNAGCEFINLAGKTDIPDLARVVKNSKCLISVDTGTMHLGYALGTKTICVFYEKDKKDIWAPDEKLYGNVKVLQNPEPDEIIKTVLSIF